MAPVWLNENSVTFRPNCLDEVNQEGGVCQIKDCLEAGSLIKGNEQEGEYHWF